MSNLFDFNMNKNDITLKRLRNHEKFYELSESMPERYDQKYLDFAYQVFADKSIMGNYTFGTQDYDEEYVKRSVKLWNELGIILHDVQYFTKDLKQLDDGYGEMDEEFVKALEIGSPANIKTNFIDNYLETGVDQVTFSSQRGEGVLFRKIDLPKLDKIITSTIYAHEITHVELSDAGGGIEHYKNKETLPIVIEELFSDKLNVLELSKNNRLATLAQAIIDMSNNPNMTFKERIDREAYLHSIFQAISLTNIYFSHNDKIKREMISDINRIFNGDFLTEDMLDKYECNFEDIEPSVKVLKR